MRKLSVHKARSGQGRIAIVAAEDPRHSSAGYREYVQTKLTEPMKAGALYSVNFYIVRDKRSVFYAPEIGAYFSTRAQYATPYTIAGAKSQVKTENYEDLASSQQWRLVHGYYKATGGEQYLTLGNFGDPTPELLDNKNVPGKLFRNDFGWYAYYYLDDVVVYEVTDTLTDKPQSHLPPAVTDKPFNNLAFVLDVSSSMKKNDKIKKLKSAVDEFLPTLNKNELISIITFEASPRVIARAMPASELQNITHKIDSLETGGGTNVNAAIASAYNLLDSSYIPGGNNRVILITDAAYQVSNHTRAVIEQHATDKQVAFSTVLFDSKPDHALKKLCHKNKGSCVQMESGISALKTQVKEPKIKWYGPGRNKTYTYFTIRLVLVTLITD